MSRDIFVTLLCFKLCALVCYIIAYMTYPNTAATSSGSLADGGKDLSISSDVSVVSTSNVGSSSSIVAAVHADIAGPTAGLASRNRRGSSGYVQVATSNERFNGTSDDDL